MAAESLLRERLPPPWNYGVTEDGRVFFINEHTRRSTWVHPILKHPVQSGHTSCPDLPPGWEKSVTPEGATYYVDHLNERTTFHHPVTGETTAGPKSVFQNQSKDDKSDVDQRRSPVRRRSPKQKVIDKAPSPSRRSDQSPIAMQGWLHKQDSGGIRSWRRRWFVLSDFCLFYYKGPDESSTLGSILLPSYRISPCTREDGISRKFAFKAEHENMRTYYFSADSKEEMTQWINALGLATVLQRDPSVDEEYRRRLREEEEAGFNPTQQLDGSLDSDHRSNSSGVREDAYRQQYQPSVHDDSNRQPAQWAQQSQNQQEPYYDDNGFLPGDSEDGRVFSNQQGRGFSSYDDHSPTQPSRDSGYISNRNSRPSQIEPGHSRQSSDSYFNQNQLNKAQGSIDLDKVNASFEKSPFFSPKHKQKEKQGMNLRPISDLFMDEVSSKGRDENFNMKPSQYPAHNMGNNQQHGRWENTPQNRYSYDSPFDQHRRRGNEEYAAPDVDYDTFTGRDPRLYKGYSESLVQPQGQWYDLKTPQERQEKLRSDRYGTLPENGHTQGPAGSSSPRQQRRNISENRSYGQNPTAPDTRHEWKERVSYQQHPVQSQHNPIYENLNTSFDNGPGRPPLPAAYRDKIVQRQDYQPNYANRTRYQQNPENYLERNQQPDYKRQSLDRASQRSDRLYSTIPADLRYGHQIPQSQQYYQTQPQQQQQSRPPQAFPVSPGLGGRKFVPQNQQQYDIQTIKEDPDMPESDILATKKIQALQNQLNGHRLRLSVTAGDLIGKSHEEMVLLLIQLRRSQSRLEDARNWYRTQMEFSRIGEKEYKRQRSTSIGRLEDALEDEHEQFVSIRKNTSELDKRLDVHKPLVNLLDNLVTMGSLYGGDNLMLTSQYKKDRLRPGEYIPPKKMIEFSRKHQEEKLVKEQEDELRQLTEDEVDLEEKLDELYKLDRELQEHSFNVSSLQEDRELLEKALQGITQQQETEDDEYALERLIHQRRTVDNELSKVRQQLAESSKILEETAVENARVENEVMLLRKRIAQSLNRSNSFPNLSDESARTRQKLERELNGIQSIMEGLNKQGAKLSQTMASLRHSNPDLTQQNKPPSSSHKKESTYAETDIDSLQTTDLATYRPINLFKGSSGNLNVMPGQADGRPVRRDQPPTKPPHTVNHQKYAQPLSIQTSVPYRTYTGYNKLPQNLSYNNNATFNNHRGGDGDYAENNLPSQDIQDADDNTKRFYGLFPKDRPRVTVRDVKKRESERRSKKYNGDSDAELSDIQGSGEPSILRPKSSHDLIRKGTEKLRRSRDEKRRSATERLFPSTSSQIGSSSIDASQRFSDLVNARPYSVRPSSLTEPTSKFSLNQTRSSPNTVATVRPVSSYTANSQPRSSFSNKNYDNHSPTTVAVKPFPTNASDVDGGLTPSKREKIRERHKGTPKARFLTVSSSSPVKLEQSPVKRELKHTAAGDLIISSQMDDDIIRADKKEDNFDPFTIDREVLFMPEKVEIPERYIPESDEDEEILTEQERRHRKEKAEQMRKMVAAHSLQDWTKNELELKSSDMHRNIEREKQRREQVLDIRHALAKEVTQKTREIAERSMLEATSPTDGGGLERSDSQRRRSELFLRTELSPNQSLLSPPAETETEYHSTHGATNASNTGYHSNPLTEQMLYYGPEALDTRQENLDATVESLDMGLTP